MKIGKPGISSFDMFSTGHAIRSELNALGGNLFNLNTAIMKLANGDDNGPRGSLDPQIGARQVQKVTNRQIGKTVSSTSGGVGPTSTPARSANLLGNPAIRRYEGHNSNGAFNFGLDGAPFIGEYYDVYGNEQNHVRFLDETIGRDLLGYTHLENAAIERNGSTENDDIYLKTTYSVFGDLNFPFDVQDIERFELGPKRYGPSQPYGLKPLETELVRKTLDGSVQGFKDKFEAFTSNREPYFGSLVDFWDIMGSSYYLNHVNGVAEHGLFVENYEADQKNRSAIYNTGSMPQSDYAYFLDVDTLSPEKDVKGLLGKTNMMFYEGKIQSLANKFATLSFHDEGRPGFLNTATDVQYGLSRGRNLRKLDLTYENAYPNPYCRVWTTHYQYSKYKNLIRGKWANASTNPRNAGTDHATLHEDDSLMRPNGGYTRLKTMTSMDTENGRPIITPYYVNDMDVMEKDSIKRCMFSIENLAWKDIIPDSTVLSNTKPVLQDARFESSIEFEESSPGIFITDDIDLYTEDGWSKAKSASITTTEETFKGIGMTLTPEQRGPNGGRIMWFPPYNLKFSEQNHANWSDNAFIGRGEKVFSYVNAERSGSLSFTLLVDHPSVINEWTRSGQQGKTGGRAEQLGKDEMILRYFAGCDSLEFNPRKEYDVKRVNILSSITEDTEESTFKKGQKGSKNDVKNPYYDENGITFYSVFYYPNDYSAGDFIGKKVSKPDKNGSTKNELPADQQHINYEEGLKEMLEKGLREDGKIGYEMYNTDKKGMTYNGKAYHTGIDKNGNEVSWFYPVDSRVNNEVLKNKERYQDYRGFGFNTSFYGTFWSDEDISRIKSEGKDAILKYLNEGNKSLDGINEETKKQLEIALSLISHNIDEAKKFIPAYNFFKHLKEVIELLGATSSEKYKYEIDVQGYASSHGYVDSNKILAENRANTIVGWMKDLKVFDFENGNNGDTIKSNGNGQIQNTNKVTESDFKPKAARVAVVTFKIRPPKTIIDEVQAIEDRVEVKKIHNESAMTDEYYDTSASDDFENQTYDNEYTYFKQLNENDDLVKRYISDKVKYFNPAFHSITPEGFNARLTFLQQCLRQGPTISASDDTNGGYGAGNLSFGRAPFCILRIGDFFNTKICINSINITYDNKGGIQWDMNPEGVGLQPMFANVDINFTFLGGSDISGPISRLQNAASFNYYANTSVYERRSDWREGFSGIENGDAANTWSPMMIKDEKKNVISYKTFYTDNGNKNTNG